MEPCVCVGVTASGSSGSGSSGSGCSANVDHYGLFDFVINQFCAGLLTLSPSSPWDPGGPMGPESP